MEDHPVIYTPVAMGGSPQSHSKHYYRDVGSGSRRLSAKEQQHKFQLEVDAEERDEEVDIDFVGRSFIDSVEELFRGDEGNHRQRERSSHSFKKLQSAASHADTPTGSWNNGGRPHQRVKTPVQLYAQESFKHESIATPREIRTPNFDIATYSTPPRSIGVKPTPESAANHPRLHDDCGV
eukprot:g1172.t1